MKKLYRSRESKVLAGVCGGLGEYFAVDPVIIRLGYIILTIFTGAVPGIIVYLLAILVIPETPVHIAESSIADEPSPV